MQLLEKKEKGLLQNESFATVPNCALTGRTTSYCAAMILRLHGSRVVSQGFML